MSFTKVLSSNRVIKQYLMILDTITYDVHRGYCGHNTLGFFLELLFSSHIGLACKGMYVCVYVLHSGLVDQLVLCYFVGFSTFIFMTCSSGDDLKVPKS